MRKFSRLSCVAIAALSTALVASAAGAVTVDQGKMNGGHLFPFSKSADQAKVKGGHITPFTKTADKAKMMGGHITPFAL